MAARYPNSSDATDTEVSVAVAAEAVARAAADALKVDVADVGEAGGVAALDASGRVLDGSGVPVESLVGVPDGGTLGQRIIKQSSTDGDTAWESGSFDPISSANGGSAATINAAAAPVHLITLNAATCALTFSGAAAGRSTSFTLVLKQDATGGRTVTWPGSVSWGGGTAPTLSTAGDAMDVISFLSVNGGTSWLGFASTAASSSSGGTAYSGAHVTRASTQTIANNTAQAIQFDTETWDVDGWHSTSSNTTRLTVPTGKGGLVELLGSIQFASNTTGLREIQIVKNGTTTVIDANMDANQNGSTVLTIAYQALVVPGDYFELKGKQNSGAGLNASQFSTFFAIRTIGPTPS